MKRTPAFSVWTVLLVSLTLCMPAFAAESDVNDPLEPVNRAIFSFNNGVDIILLEPLAKGYRFVMPEYARDRVHHAVTNLGEPLSTVNYLLQGKFVDSGDSLLRFAVNSTFGLAGLYDVVGDQSDDKQTGFGDTLAKWGVGMGPYLVLPFIGPSSLRDTAGMVADRYGDPVAITVRASGDIRHPETLLAVRRGVEILDARARLLKQIDDLRKNSLDFYAAMRSIYLQRAAAKAGRNQSASISLPDYN